MTADPSLTAAIRQAEEALVERTSATTPQARAWASDGLYHALDALLAAAREAEAVLAEEREKLDTAHSANAELALRVGALEAALAEAETALENANCPAMGERAEREKVNRG